MDEVEYVAAITASQEAAFASLFPEPLRTEAFDWIVDQLSETPPELMGEACTYLVGELFLRLSAKHPDASRSQCMMAVTTLMTATLGWRAQKLSERDAAAPVERAKMN